MTITMSSAHSPTFFVALPTSQFILQSFRRFTYVTAHSPILPLLHLRHSSFSNPSFTWLENEQSSNLSVTSPTSQLILQQFPSLHLRHSSFFNNFRHLTYVTDHSPIIPSLYLRHSSFSNPSFVSPTSQALHLCHLSSRPWVRDHRCLYIGETGRGL